jgi:predicted RNase H-like HicB family nuclease
MNTTSTIKDYGIHVYWDGRAGYFVAEIPEIPTCAADGATQAEALANLEEAFAVLKEAYAEESRSLPYSQPDLSVSARQLAEASEVIKISRLAELAGIPVQTLASKLKRGTELNVGESRKIARALKNHGLAIGKPPTAK